MVGEVFYSLSAMPEICHAVNDSTHLAIASIFDFWSAFEGSAVDILIRLVQRICILGQMFVYYMIIKGGCSSYCIIMVI